MNLHPRAARGGLYFFASTDGANGTTVRLAAWLGRPLRWSTRGEIGPNERIDLLAQGYDPVTVLIDGLMA